MNYNPEPISYELWRSRYKPVLDDHDNDYPLAYETFQSDTYQWDWDAMLEMATSFANGDPDKAFLHIWTELDSDDGEEVILSNGIRRVNRIQYYICKIPFADTVEDGVKLYQEVHDEIEGD